MCHFSLRPKPKHHRCQLRGNRSHLQSRGPLWTHARSRRTLPAGLNFPRARLLSITTMAARSNAIEFSGCSASKHDAESLLDTIRVNCHPRRLTSRYTNPRLPRRRWPPTLRCSHPRTRSKSMRRHRRCTVLGSMMHGPGTARCFYTSGAIGVGG